MNYIEQINNFWAVNEELQLKSNEIAVYFALLKYNNSLGWIESFRCDYAIICQYAGVSKNTFYNVIDTLKELKLITYEKGERNVLKPKISILKIKNRKGIIKEQIGNNEGTEKEQTEEQKGNLYKLLNNKTIKLLNTHAELVNNNLKVWIDKHLEETKDVDIDNEFLEFWNLYDKKNDAKKCRDKFKLLTQSEKEAIKKHLPIYVKNTPDKQFRKNPLTYLNQKTFLDEIIEVSAGFKNQSNSKFIEPKMEDYGKLRDIN